MGGTNFSDGGIRNGGTTDNYLTNDAGNVIFLRCTTANIPSAKSGYAVGCELQAGDTGVWYSNTGTTASCTFTTSSLVRTGNKGYAVVEVTANGTSDVNVFGTTNGFAGTLTGAYAITSGTISTTITIKNAGLTVGTIATGATVGLMAGATSVSNATFTSAGTMSVVSNNASDTAKVFITFTVT